MTWDYRSAFTPCVDCGIPCAKDAERCRKCAGIYKRANRPDKLCACGCSQPLPRKNYARDYAGRVYLPEHRPKFTGPNSPNWKGGRYLDTHGYVRIYKPDHHEANKDGCVLEHRFNYENFYNVVLLPGQILHHVNGVKTDNRPENLQIVTRQAHVGIHTLKYTLDDLLPFIPEVFAAYGEWPDSVTMTKDKRFPVYRVWRRVLGCKNWAEVEQKVTEIHNLNYQ